MLAEPVDPLTHPEALPWLLMTPLFVRDSGTGAELRRLVDEVRSQMGVGLLPNVLFHVARDQATSNAWPRAAGQLRGRRSGSPGRPVSAPTWPCHSLDWLGSSLGRASRLPAGSMPPRRSSCAPSEASGRARCGASSRSATSQLSEGNARAAADTFLDVGRRLQDWGIVDPDLYPGAELVDSLVRLGKNEAATADARRFAAAAAAKGQPWSTARAQRALGLVASDADLDAPFLSAAEAHQETRDLFEAARTMLAYGARLRRAHRRVDARVQLRSALETFEELGAVQWARTAAVELEATGEKVTRRSSSGTESLTSQELQVSLLLAEGRTTRETAAALFLSPKTVEYHLRKIYVKLGIHSRSELAELFIGE